jgi:hypothetical protein
MSPSRLFYCELIFTQRCLNDLKLFNASNYNNILCNFVCLDYFIDSHLAPT